MQPILERRKNPEPQFDNTIDYKAIGLKPNSKQFKRFYKAGLLNKIDVGFAKEVRSYWKEKYNKEVNPVLHIAIANLTGIKDTRYVPSKEMWNEIIPYLNDMNIRIGYSDKNLYDKLINAKNSAETVFKSIRGHFYDAENNLLRDKNIIDYLTSYKEDLIIKPSDNDNGRGIAKIIYEDGKLFLNNKKLTISLLKETYGFNFIVQKVIEQHSEFAKPHPASVNTLRMVTLRYNNEIKHLLTYARFGGGNNVQDHAVHGGVSVGVKENGELMDFALDTNCMIHTHHPTTNYDFTQTIKVPNYKSYIKYVKDLHKQILHHDLVSWDIAVGKNGEPIFIESNFRGSSWRYQLVSQKPIFGDLTSYILKDIAEKVKKPEYDRSIRYKMPIHLRRRVRRDKRERDRLVKKLNSLEKKVLKNKTEKEQLKREIEKLRNSKSWKVTKPLRKLNSMIKGK